MSEVVICALITGVFAWLTARTNARASADNREILARLERVERRVASGELMSERNDLLAAIRVSPDDTAEVMVIAKRYFLELHGNSYASKPFAHWALTYHIDISDLYTSHNDLKFYMDNPELCYDAYHKTIK